MKKVISLALFAVSGFVLAQNSAAIDRTKEFSTSASLQFGDNQNKGFVLPYVTSAANVDANGAVDGTLIYDRTTNSIRGRQNGAWTNFTAENGTVDATIQVSATEDLSKKTIIGATKSTVPGVLILEQNNKAMVLPREAAPHLTIKNPAPGMMVYDTTNKLVAFYNGTAWSFWK